MCDNFEFEDDDDDLLLNAICTPPEETVSPVKRLSEASNESNSSKKPKLDECTQLSPPLFNEVNNTSDTTSQSPTHISHMTINETSRRPKNDNSITNTQYCTKRLFPGPAGIFSDTNITLNSQVPVCSQNTSVIFQDGPWQEMSKDFRISDTLCLYDKFNIAWLKKEAAKNQFASQKAPFLAAVLMSMEVSDLQTQKCVNITLKDKTGSIQGNILHSLYEEYTSHFTLGSILILVQFGVLSCTCDKCDNHHLTITPKNLSAIYNGNDKLVIKKILPQDVLNDFYRRKQDLITKNMPDKTNMPKMVLSSSRICNFSFNNKQNIFQSPLNTEERSRIVSKDAVIGQKLETPVDRDSNKNRYKKMFNFKKAPALKLNSMNSQNISDSEAFSNNMNDNKHPNSNKKIFTFKKVNLSEASDDNSLLNIEDQSKTRTECSGNNIKLAGSQISVRVDNKEHEKLWKDALDDVDINSFFDEDF